MTITIHMNRVAGQACFAGHVTTGTDPWRQMCQVIRDWGHADDDAVVIDEHNTPCWTIKSVYDVAHSQDARDAKLATFRQSKRRAA